MAYKKQGFFGKVRKFVNKQIKTVKAKAAKNVQKRHEKYIKNETNKQARFNERQRTAEAKQQAYQAERVARRMKVDRDAQSGGLRGWRARRLQTKIAKGDSQVELEKLKPALAQKSAKTQMETEATVKKTKAQGAAFATAASALGGSYATKSVAESEARKAKAEADIAATEALQQSLNTVPSVTTDPYSDKSVSGLVTGVR